MTLSTGSLTQVTTGRFRSVTREEMSSYEKWPWKTLVLQGIIFSTGAQACKSLKEEGYEVILVNSNPATIMTDPELSDKTYIEPITKEFVALKALKFWAWNLVANNSNSDIFIWLLGLSKANNKTSLDSKLYFVLLKSIT